MQRRHSDLNYRPVVAVSFDWTGRVFGSYRHYLLLTCYSDAGSPGDSGFYGTFQGTTFPFFVERPKICDNIKPHCPLKPSSRYTYKNTVSTSEAYPNVHLTGRWVLNNTEGKPMVCVQFPIQIVEK
ncbi:hypothetical protein CRM22_006759 [Opisthorchis felineus]|uniref:MD-2-related lipid-recognition domain-containing protein n=1 Tax=Opisthorchis felineus TaxID=147828 RepID=A0A4S2LSC6_OPIFE|nr:hypothetical protein CRM22_006759 [Opisthorchis felineus]